MSLRLKTDVLRVLVELLNLRTALSIPLFTTTEAFLFVLPVDPIVLLQITLTAIHVDLAVILADPF